VSIAKPTQTTTMVKKKIAMRLIYFLCGTRSGKRKDYALVKTEHRKGFFRVMTVMRYGKVAECVISN
jgi:hypothetical protein